MNEIWKRIDAVASWVGRKIDGVLSAVFSQSGARLIVYCTAQAASTFLAYSWVKVWENEPKTMADTMHPFILVCLVANVVLSVSITIRSFLDQSVTKQKEGGYEPNNDQNPTGGGGAPGVTPGAAGGS